MSLAMTDTPHSGSAAGSVPQAIPTAAEAFARLDMPLVEAMMTQRAVGRVLPDPFDDAVVLKCIELALRALIGPGQQAGPAPGRRFLRGRQLRWRQTVRDVFRATPGRLPSRPAA
jgi:hypothetical protein